ncbi:unnamed protein product [Phytomonas sp. EM1]|nr:unnamed protein product [Phytomonas sp. EM1]|eukprot:CCW60891.1 unnamed protein product [Phytomonas sp. isolate EM1]
MSVAESFLRGGTPSTSIQTFQRDLSTTYSAWCWTLVYPRRWHLDTNTNTIAAPVFHFLFGQPAVVASSSPDDAKIAEASSWHLLYATVQEKSSSERVAQPFKEVWSTLPSGLRASITSFALVAVLKGHTHERLNLFCQDQWERVAMGVRDEVMQSVGVDVRKNFVAAVFKDNRLLWQMTSPEAPASLGTTSLPEGGPSWLPFMTGGLLNSGVFEKFTELLDQVTRWLETKSNLSAEARDVSIPAQGRYRPLLELVSHINPILYRTRFMEPGNVEKMLPSATDPTCPQRTPAVPDPEDLTGIEKLKAQRDANWKALKLTKGEGTSFSVPELSSESVGTTENTSKDEMTAVAECDTGCAGANTRPFRHVFLLQRPPKGKQTPENDYREVGPVKPQPIGAEFHLYQDIGDVFYVVDEFNNNGLMDFNCDNYLPEEGEVLVQLGPIEGVPFDDIDFLLDFQDSISSVQGYHNKELLKHQHVQCEGSCSDLVFPRVVHRLPTNQTTKLNPIARNQLLVGENSPTIEMLLAATATLNFFVNNIVDLHARYGWKVGVGESGYTVAGIPPLALPPALLHPLRRCASCGRRREKLLRCSGCKVIWYCSQKHQALEWKSGKHKVECALWRKNREDAARNFQSQLTAARLHETEGRIMRTAGWSCAVATLEYLSSKADLFISDEGKNPNQITPPLLLEPLYVHVIGVETAWVKDFVQVMGSSAGSFLSPFFGFKQRQLRLVVFTNSSTSVPDKSLHNSVFAVPSLKAVEAMTIEGDTVAVVDGVANPLKDTSKSGEAVLVAPTYVVGDVWHVEGGESSALAREAAMLIRICDCKYHSHQLVEGVTNSSPAPNPPGAAGCQSEAVISFGPSNGEGLNFFSGTLEVCARSKVGHVPIRFLESSLVGAYHTAQALLARLDAREDKPGTCALNMLKTGMLNISPKEDNREERGLFRLNKHSVCFDLPFLSGYHGKAAVDEAVELILINSYYFDVPTF